MENANQAVKITVDERPTDSPFVERIWRSHSEGAGNMLSMAVSHWEMVITHLEGKINVAVRGPETAPSVAYCPADGKWLGIQFKLGVLMPHLPVSDLVNSAVELPEATRQSFWLQGASWQFPTFENADVFVARLVRERLLVREPLVEAALQNQRADVTLRSVQRRFLRATGLTHGAVEQIARARHATRLLQEGVSILDTVEWAGYYDQPHLTKALKRLIGQTPAQLLAGENTMPLSFLSKTE